MKNHVTVVPIDRLIIVDGEALIMQFNHPEEVRALQWYEGLGHIEFVEPDRPNQIISGTDDYVRYIASFVGMWEEEYLRQREEAERQREMEEQGDNSEIL